MNAALVVSIMVVQTTGMAAANRAMLKTPKPLQQNKGKLNLNIIPTCLSFYTFTIDKFPYLEKEKYYVFGEFFLSAGL